jgi:GT2 family glycosyltransferase
VIIPTKYRIDLLEKCLTGLRAKTGYPDLEVIVVDNGADDPRFAGVLADAASQLDLRKIEQVGPFNFSQLVNAGVRVSSGEVVLLLNDDVEPIASGWLHRLVASAAITGVGAVGAYLTYPNGSVQHAGVVLGLGGVCGHLWRGLGPVEASRNVYVQSSGTRMAVTGACLAVRREAFDAVGGFDEKAFPVAFNDIDFCLRLHAAGYRNVYRGDAKLIHHESQSRGPDDASATTRGRLAVETSRFMQRWKHLVSNDPHFSPAFDSAVERGVAHPAGLASPADYFL